MVNKQYFLTNKHLLGLFVLLLVTLINYWRVPFLFWQQDEWVTFSNFIQSGASILWHGLTIESTHFSPVTNFLGYICFKIFGLNYSVYLVLGLLFHLLNGFLILKITEKIIPRYIYSLLAAVLFIGSSASYQLLMWPVISLNSVSLTFTLLAIIVLINFITSNSLPFFWGIILTLYSALSLFTIEYSAGILLFIPITLFSYYASLGRKNTIIFVAPFLLFTVFYAILRFYYMTPLNIALSSSQSNQYLVNSNTVSYPFYYLGQIYIPESIIIQISRVMAEFTNTDETFYFFKVSAVFSIIFILFTFYAIKITDSKKLLYLHKIIYLTFLFIFSSSLPFTLLSGSSGDFSIFPSRYLYFGSAGGSFLLVILLYYFKSKKMLYVFKTILTLVIIFIVSSTYQNFQKSKDLYDQGKTRESILKTVRSSYPSLPQKVIFYFESDTSYYGLPPEDKIPPFQAGLGQILLIWYSNNNTFPTKFYQNQYLWDIKDEGYMEVNGNGYGYFRTWEKLQEVYYSHDLRPHSVIAFSWKGKTNSLTDITLESRHRLINYSFDKSIK